MVKEDNLPALMQKLPQEIFDQIHEQVFAVEPGIRDIQRGGWKPPVQLQVDRASREKFAGTYFGAGSVIAVSDIIDVFKPSSCLAVHLGKITSFRMALVNQGGTTPPQPAARAVDTAWVGLSELYAVLNHLDARRSPPLTLLDLTNCLCRMTFRVYDGRKVRWEAQADGEGDVPTAVLFTRTILA